MAILQYHLPFAEPEMLAMTVEFLQQAHELKLDFSPRDGINLLRYAMKRLAQDPKHPLGQGRRLARGPGKMPRATTPSTSKPLPSARARTLGGDSVPLGLGDFFFDPDDPLHPDREEDEEE